MCVSSSTNEPSYIISSSFYSMHTMVNFSNDDSEDENPPSPIKTPLAPNPQLPWWVSSTWEAIGDLMSDPSDQHHFHLKF